MTHLSDAQMRVVGAPPDLPDGVDWPDVEVEIHDLGEIDETTWTQLCRGHPRRRVDDRTQRPSVVPYLAVFTYEGQWFLYVETRGMSSRSIGRATRDEVVAEAHDEVAQFVGFWMEKVKWRLAGDRAPRGNHRFGDTQQVIRCDGCHYVVGHEPSKRERSSPYGGLGFGGRTFAFVLYADDRKIETHNLWDQGDIPREFAELLPDNAFRVASEEDIAQDYRRSELRIERAVQAQERRWRDEALAAWRGPAAELRAHELLVAYEAAEREKRRRDNEERAARELAQDWADEAYRAWRGTWTDLQGPMKAEWDAILEEREMEYEMWREQHDVLGY